jgi:hypothetical protein
MRAGWLVLIVGITSVAACGGGTFAARDEGGGGSGAEQAGGQGGGAPTGGVTGDGGGAGGCVSAQDCPVTDSCQRCWDGSCVSSTANCINGQCVVTPGVCPRNPCEGVACGGSCELCGPSTCQTGFCDGAGACVAAAPRCPCDPDTPCPQPANPACIVCANTTTVCANAVCYRSQCQLTRPRCPCEAMQAAASGDCALVLGAAWNGTICVGLSGCECTGADCPSLFPDVLTCKDKQSQCLTSTTG